MWGQLWVLQLETRRSPSICNYKVLQDWENKWGSLQEEQAVQGPPRGHSSGHELDCTVSEQLELDIIRWPLCFWSPRLFIPETQMRNTGHKKQEALKLLIALCRENCVKWTCLRSLVGTVRICALKDVLANILIYMEEQSKLSHGYHYTGTIKRSNILL